MLVSRSVDQMARQRSCAKCHAGWRSTFYWATSIAGAFGPVPLAKSDTKVRLAIQ
jgi:hypothetical protein